MSEAAPVKLLLCTRDAAAALDVSERTLFDLWKRGEIDRVPLPRGGFRYSVDDLKAFIERAKSRDEDSGE